MDKDLQEKLKDLQDQIDQLRMKRIHEHDILPGEIKSKHISEGPKWIRGGTATDKPTVGEPTDNGYAVYLDITNNRIYFYNGSAWKYASLT